MITSADDRLYHYTTVESFGGIIERGELWASHIRYLNDTSEQRLMKQLIRAGAETRLKDAQGTLRDRLITIQQLVDSPLNEDRLSHFLFKRWW